jgi:hypothetical protein
MLEAMRTARRVTFSAYVLWPGDVRNGLEHAAQRGAHVSVRLNGYMYKGSARMHRDNRNAVRALRRLGADAQIVHRNEYDGPCLHLKAVVCDGVAFLDDRNWLTSGKDTVVRDDNPEDVPAIRKATQYRHADCSGVQLDKYAAVAKETALLRSARGDGIAVAAEEFGYSSVYTALKKLAARGAKPRVLISERGLRGRSAAAVQHLKQAGIRVRVTTSDEKFAVAGSQAWVGSANPTPPFPDGKQFDWGVETRSPQIVSDLRTRFEAAWKQGCDL